MSLRAHFLCRCFLCHQKPSRVRLVLLADFKHKLKVLKYENVLAFKDYDAKKTERLKIGFAPSLSKVQPTKSWWTGRCHEAQQRVHSSTARVVSFYCWYFSPCYFHFRWTTRRRAGVNSSEQQFSHECRNSIWFSVLFRRDGIIIIIITSFFLLHQWRACRPHDDGAGFRKPHSPLASCVRRPCFQKTCSVCLL